jgi:hypothetical protein
LSEIWNIDVPSPARFSRGLTLNVNSTLKSFEFFVYEYFMVIEGLKNFELFPSQFNDDMYFFFADFSKFVSF